MAELSLKGPPLYEHQKEITIRARKLRSVGIFFETGVGKSRAAIEILREKFAEEGRVLRTLIFAPPIVVKNWSKELRMYSNIKDVTCLVGSGRKRLKTFRERKDFPHIFLLNYQSLLMNELFDELISWKSEFQIYDEGHYLKDPKSKRSKRALMLSNSKLSGKEKPPIKLLLTATPILNSPLDIFNQYLVLDGGETFGKSFFKFRALYFVDRNSWMRHAGRPHFPKYEYKTSELDGFDALKEISEKMKHNSMVVKKKDVLKNLPPFVTEKRYVGMSPLQAKAYKEMKRDFITFMGSKACTADLAIVKALRLMQITSGFIKSEDGKENSFTCPKKEALKELLQQLTPDHQVIVWAVWRQNYEDIRQVCEDLNLSSVEIHGGVSSKEKDRAVEQFNNNKKFRVLIGNPTSAGLGINLIASNYSIFYSRNFSLEASIQAEARNYRSGSEIHDRVTRIDIVTEGTIDELIVEKLLAKEKISAKVLGNLKGEI